MAQPAARVGDQHLCPPHRGGPILSPGCPSVLIGNLPAARLGDLTKCGKGTDPIVEGSATVFIAGEPAARVGDKTAGNGAIVTGLASVLIGDRPASGMSLNDAARAGNFEVFSFKFDQIIGMSVEQSIDKFRRLAKEDIDRQTIMTLFSDPDAAYDILMRRDSVHTVYREILNTHIPPTEGLAIRARFRLLSFLQSLCHDAINNSKYVSEDGHLEAVYETNTGKLVTERSNKGTFNFFGPDDPGHERADFDPWLLKDTLVGRATLRGQKNAAIARQRATDSWENLKGLFPQ